MTTRYDLVWPLVKVILLVCAVILVLWFADRRFKFIQVFLSEKRGPLDLALTRIVIFSLLIVHYRLRDFLPFAHLDPALIVAPKGWGLLAAHVPRNPSLVTGTYFVFLIASICAILGLGTAIAAWTSALSGLYLYTIPQLFGKVNHYHHLILFALLLAASPCADALSIESFWRNHKRLRPPVSALTPTLRHAAPLKVMTVMIGLIYFFPGAWKLCRAGGTWFTADSMRWQILTQAAQGMPTALQAWILQHPNLLVMGAAFTVCFELGFLFAALNKRSRPFAALAGLGFHNLTFLLMHISFYILQFSYVILIDWSAAVRFVLRSRQKVGSVSSVSVSESRKIPLAYSHSPVFYALSAVFTIGLVLAGVGHAVETWPIACYPTFDGPPQWQIPVLSIEAHGWEGFVYRDIASTDDLLGAPYVGRWPAMVAVFMRPNTPFSQKRANALVQIWKTGYHHDDIAFVDLYVDTYDLSKVMNNMVSRRAIGRVDYRN